MPRTELANWGGWWRNRFRENPAKSRAILAELRSMIREGRITGNPGAAAVRPMEALPLEGTYKNMPKHAAHGWRRTLH